MLFNLAIVLIILFTLLVLSQAYSALFMFITIVGSSMYPTYKDGEFHLMLKVLPSDKISKGDVVLFNSPTDLQGLSLKRVTDIKEVNGEEMFYLLGDNSNDSLDSRFYGYVYRDTIKAKFIKPREKGSL